MLAGYDHLLLAARRLQWDAEAIGLEGDREVLRDLPAPPRARLAALVGGFVVAEHAVAEELEPFVAAAAALDTDPRAAECFAAQAADERRHARWFDRLAAELLGLDRAAARAAAPPAIRHLFETELPAAARALADGASPESLAAGVGLYHLVLEGIAFAVGQQALLELARTHRLEGVCAGTGRVQSDERWHVGLGVLALRRLSAGAPPLDEAARRAATAWGTTLIAPEQVEQALTVHARRLAIAVPLAGAESGAG